MAANDITGESGSMKIRPDRRAFGKAVLAGILAGPAAMSSVVQAAAANQSEAKDNCMKLALALQPSNEQKWILARQIGVNHAIVSVNRVLNRIKREKYLDTLVKLNSI